MNYYEASKLCRKYRHATWKEILRKIEQDAWGARGKQAKK